MEEKKSEGINLLADLGVFAVKLMAIGAVTKLAVDLISKQKKGDS
jgi:hypothetical protein